MKDLISVVVPVYNTEQYLRECVESIKNQTYENFEIVLIDDGSADGSPKICRAYSEQQDNIFFYQQENKGAAAARNEGIRRARGTYICFIDSDDVIHPQYLETLYDNLVQYDADVSACGYSTESMQEQRDDTVQLRDKMQILMDLTTTGPGNRSEYWVVPCTKLFKKSILEQTSFPQGKWHEDEFIVHRYVKLANRIVATEKVLYYYRRHENGATGKTNSKDRRHLDSLEAFEDRMELFSELKGSPVYQAFIVSFLDNATLLYLLQEDLETRAEWKTIIFPKMKKMMAEKRSFLTKFQLAKYHIFLMSPKLYKMIFWH